MSWGSRRVKVSREQLYAEVWTEPMAKLAKRYGISDVGLKKVFKKQQIPTPGRGYWAKVKAGQKPPRPRLPKLPDARPVIITASLNSGDSDAKLSRTKDVSETVKRYRELEARSEKKIMVKAELRHLHPVAREVHKTLKGAKPNYYGALECVGAHLVRVRVSPENVKRVVLIVDALVREAQKRGFKVAPARREAPYGKWERAALVVEGEKVAFRLSEKSRRSPHKPTREEERRARDDFWYRIPAYDYTFTGTLKLDILHDAYYSPYQTLGDTVKQQLEERLNEVMVALYELVDFCREREAQRQEQARQAAEAQRRRLEEEQKRAELRRRQELEAAHVQELLKDAEAYRQAQELRAYLEAVKWVMQQPVGGSPQEHKFNAWLAWTEAQADALNPLKPDLLARITQVELEQFPSLADKSDGE